MAEFVFEAQITDRHGNPLIGVDVEAIDSNLITAANADPTHGVVAVNKTGINGVVRFPNLPIGVYYARPRINRDDVRIQITIPSGMGGGGKMCYAALVQPNGVGTHTTIQAAITDLGVTGGVIFICSGTYNESLSVATNTDNLWLIGASRAEVILQGTGAAPAINFVATPLAGSQDNLRIENMTIDGNANKCIVFNAEAGATPRNVHLRNLRLINGTVGIEQTSLNGGENFKLSDIEMESSVLDAGQLLIAGIEISNCYYYVAGKGLYVGGATAVQDVKINNCTFNGGNSYALRAVNTTKLVMSNCRVIATGDNVDGILLGNNAMVAISTTVFEIHEGVGINANAAVLTGLTLENLQLVCAMPQGTDRIGIDIGTNVSELVVDGCRIKNFESYGIKLGVVQDWVISNCVIINGGDTHSIYLNGADYGVVVGCVLRGTGGVATTYGIYGTAGVTNTTIVGNTTRDHDDSTNLVHGVNNNVVAANNPVGGGGAAFHNPVTLAADAAVLLDLTDQEIGLDSQGANVVFAGPAAGPAADPTFRSLVDADIPADIARDAEVTAAVAAHEGAGDPHAGYMTPAEHTAVGDSPPHHAPVTLGAGSDPALALAAQELTLADVLTPAEHTAIGNDPPHHTRYTDAEADARIAALAVEHSDIAPAEGFVRKTGAGAYTAHKSNLAAAVAPTVNDDSAAGYSVGSVWINLTTDAVYMCADAGVGVAVWSNLSAGGGGGHTIRNEGIDLPARTGLNLIGGLVVGVDDAGGDESEVRIGLQPDGTDLFATADAAPHLSIGVAGKVIELKDTLRFGTAAVAHLQDSAGNERLRLATVLPHILLTGAVKTTSGLAVMGGGPTTNIGVRVQPTNLSGTFTGVQVAPVGHTLTANNQTFLGVQGVASVTALGNYTNLKLEGLNFAATASADAVSPTWSEVQGVHVKISAQITNVGTNTVSLMRGLYLEQSYLSAAGGGTLVITDYRMLDLRDPASATVKNLYGVKIDDCSAATGGTAPTNRILELGPTPYMRLLGSGSWTPTANQTPLYVAEGSPAALRQVQWKAGNSLVAGDKVLVLV